MEQQKKKYLAYRILGAVDNFIAILFLFLLLINFAATGFNLQLLFPIFATFSMLLYTNLTAVFARYVMAGGNFFRAKWKDWIKVNAYVTLLCAAFVIVTFSWGLLERTSIQSVSSAMDVPADLVVRVMLIFTGCMLLLIIHVIMTFRYLKQFKDRFRDPEQPQ